VKDRAGMSHPINKICTQNWLYAIYHSFDTVKL